MSSTPINEVQTCLCGRAFSHCKNDGCGSKNVYVKKSRSFEVSAQQGRMVTVYGCRRCLRESTSEKECKAPSREFNPEFKAYQKSVETQEIPWGTATPGTEAHYRLLVSWIEERQIKKNWGRVKVYVEAQKAGWHLEAYPEIDEDVKQALVNQGLWPLIQEVPMQEETGAVATEKPPTPLMGSTEPVSLEEIIKNMQGNSK